MRILLFFGIGEELPIEFICLFFPLMGLAGFFLARWNPLLLIIPYLLILLFAAGQLSELSYPDIYVSVVSYFGQSYVTLSYVSIAIGLIPPLAGIPAWGIRRRKRPLR